jgi:adenosine kinase
MNIVVTGSIAYDYLMTFRGRFKDHILPDQLDRLSLSFLVEDMVRHRGGIAANIAYTLGLLGEHPLIMATVGEDFEEYRSWLEEHGVDPRATRVIRGLFTASFFVNTDSINAQIASFYTGAMANASDLHFADLDPLPDLAIISPNDPGAMIQYVEECRSLGIAYLYDPSQQIVSLEAEPLLMGIEGCTGLLANDYELSLILEKTGLSLEEIRSKTDFTIVTLGEKGIDLHLPEETRRIPAVKPDKIVDPTGVGDAFRGGFLKGYAHDLQLERCCQMGALAATYCLESLGTQGHQFDLDTFRQRFIASFDSAAELESL